MPEINASLNSHEDVHSEVSANTSIEQPRNSEMAAEVPIFSLLAALGFSVTEKEVVADRPDSMSRRLTTRSESGDSKEGPTGWYQEGKFHARKTINGHTITVAFTPMPNQHDFDAGIFVDNEYISANHDWSEAELLNNIRMAIAMATFETSPEKIPTWTPEYEQLIRKFNDIIATTRE